MTDLEYRPQHLVPPLPFVRRVLGVLHLVAELEQRVLDVFEAVGGRFAVATCAYGGHLVSLLGGGGEGSWGGVWMV